MSDFENSDEELNEIRQVIYNSDDEKDESDDETEIINGDETNEETDDNDEDEETETNEEIEEEEIPLKDCISDLNNFLNAHRCSGSDANIVRFSYPRGSYYIPKEEYNDFLDLVYSLTNNSNYKPTSYLLNIYERLCPIKPLLIDLDYDYKVKVEDRIYNSTVEKVILMINDIVKKFFKIDNVKIYLLEKSRPTIRSKNQQGKSIREYKDGVHIHVCHPFNPNQREFLYSEIVKTAKERKLFEGLPIINDYDSIFDHSTINTNAWPLFSSTKIYEKKDDIINPEHTIKLHLPSGEIKQIYYAPIYNLTKTYINGQLVDNPDPQSLLSILTIRRFELNNSPVVELNDGIDPNLINEFTYKKEKKTTTTNKRIKDIPEIKNFNEFQNIIDTVSYINNLVESYNISIVEQQKIKEALIYLALIDPKRSDIYEHWRDIGWSLKSVHSLLKDVFIKFSKLSSKFDLNECEKIWASGKTGQGMCSILNLKKMAYEDNREKYLQLNNENQELIKIALNNNSDDLATFIVAYLPLYTVSGNDEDKKRWYKFTSNRLVLDKNLHEVYETIHYCAKVIKDAGYKCEEAKKLNEQTETKINHLKALLDNVDPDQSQTEQKNYNNQIKILINNREKKMKKILEPYNKVYKILKDVQNRKSLIIQACGNKLLYINNNYGMCINEKNQVDRIDKSIFENILDSNDKLLGFPNGVYNIETGEFRKGLPSDYITLTTKYDYKEFKGDEDIIKEVYKYFASIQSDPEVCEYVINILANCLFEGNKEQKFFILFGGGANGKSIMCDLMHIVLGDYFNTADVSLLTNKNKSTSSASPETIALKNKRMTFLNETNQGDELNLAKMKQLTGGGDEMVARLLFSNDIITFTNLSTLFMATNNLPAIISNDGGTWRRIVVIPFKNTFVEKLPSEQEIEAKKKIGVGYSLKDKTLKDKIKNVEFVQAVMWVLIQHYKKIKKSGKDIPVPEIVQRETTIYRNDHDYFAKFLDECCIVGIEHKVFLKDLKTAFNRFMKDNNTNRTNNTEILNASLRVNGYHTGKEENIRYTYVYGLKLNDDDDNESSPSINIINN